MIDLRIVVPAAGAWIATVALLPFPAAMIPASIAAWCLAAGLLVITVLARRRIPVVIAVTAGAIALVATSAAVHAEPRRPTELLNGPRHVSAVTVLATQTISGSSRYFAATLVRAGGRAMSVPVTVFDAAPAGRTEIGASLRVSGRLLPTAPEDDTSFLVFADGPARVVAPPSWYLAWADGLRGSLADASAALPGDGGELLPGLAIGDTTRVDGDLTDAMKTSALRHTLLPLSHVNSDLHPPVFRPLQGGGRRHPSVGRVPPPRWRPCRL